MKNTIIKQYLQLQGFASKQTWTNHYSAQVQPGANGQYVETCNGYSATSIYSPNFGAPYRDVTELRWTESSSSMTTSFNGGTSSVSPIPSGFWPDIPDEDQIGSDGYGPVNMTHSYADTRRWYYPNGVALNVDARSQWKLYTGGKAKINRKNLIEVNVAGAEEYGKPPGNGSTWWWGTPTTSIALTRIEMFGFAGIGSSHLDSSGNAYRVLPDNAAVDLNVWIPGVKHYYVALPTAQKFKLVHETVNQALTDTNKDRTNLGVGEEVILGFKPEGVTTSVTWKTSAGGMANYEHNYWDITDQQVFNLKEFTAPSNAANVTITTMVAGQTLKEKFKVFEPSGIATNTYKEDELTIGYGHSGAGMDIRVYVAPTNVSFYRVTMEEVGEDATSVWGYYTNNPPYTTNWLSHKGSTTQNGHGKGDDPFQIFADNSWQHGADILAWDRAKCLNIDPNPPNCPLWSSGGFIWNIPGAWTVDGSTWHTNMIPWSQVFTIQPDGTMTIQKFGLTVTRSPSSP